MMLLLLVAILLITLLLIHFGIQWYRNYKIINKMPGPPGLPILGNMLDFLCSPEEIWNKLREHSRDFYPIYRTWQCGKATVHLLNPEDIKIVLSSSKHSAKSQHYNPLHPWLQTGLLTSYGDKWKARRRILTSTFHFHILQEFFAVFQEETKELVTELEKECAKPSTDIVPIITYSTLKIICETAMGTKLGKTKECEEYTEAIHGLGNIVTQRLFRPWYFMDFTFRFTSLYKQQQRFLKTLHSFTTAVIQKRQIDFDESQLTQAPKPDGEMMKKKRLAMLDLLLSARRSGQSIDDDGIREEVDTFMFEGHDTTTACISFTLMLLACNKDIQDRVVEELEEVLGTLNTTPTMQDINNLPYLDQVLKESLRLYPSVSVLTRVTDDIIETSTGYKIPSRSDVFLEIYDLHRDPDIYPDPDKFDPERFSHENSQGRHPFAYIPFSAGPRNCIGQKFAMLEIKTVLAAILSKFVLEPVDTPESVAIILHFVTRTENGIRIKLRMR